MLLRAGIIDEEKLERAIEHQRNQGGKIYGALVKLDLVDEDDVVEFLSRQLGLPTVSLEEIDVDPDAVKLLAAEKAQKYMAIPYGQVNSTLYVAMADPTDLNAIDDIKFMTNMSVEVSIATESQIKKALDTFYDAGVMSRTCWMALTMKIWRRWVATSRIWMPRRSESSGRGPCCQAGQLYSP